MERHWLRRFLGNFAQIVETLAAAWLASDCGFDGGAAAAWARMATPPPAGARDAD